MLTSFSVKNFRSFKDQATLSMVPENLDENNHHLIQNNKMNAPCLPAAVIYGANGSGKSNILLALKALVSFLTIPVLTIQNNPISKQPTHNCRSNNYRIEELRERIVPFAFQKDSPKEPTEFELIFDGKLAQYKYSLKILDSSIQKEKLEQYKYETSRSSLVFERQGKTIKKGRELKDIQIPRELNDKLSLLSYCAISFNHNPVIDDAMEWLSGKVDFVNFGHPEDEAVNRIAADYAKYAEYIEADYIESEVMAGKIADMFRELELDIAGFRLDKRNPDHPQIFIKHKIGEDTYELNLKEESRGIQKLFALIPHIIQALEQGSVLVIDEMDASIHPRILQHIIWLFTSSSQNPKGAQLIFTSNDLSSMTADNFRKDEIWFAAKNCLQESQLYSLSDFRDENGKPVAANTLFYKQYMEGCYGADPFIQRSR